MRPLPNPYLAQQWPVLQNVTHSEEVSSHTKEASNATASNKGRYTEIIALKDRQSNLTSSSKNGRWISIAYKSTWFESPR